MKVMEPWWPAGQADWLKLAGVFIGIAVVAVAHCLTPRSEPFWLSTFQHLYYVPIVLAGIWFGWLGGIAAALCSGLCFIFIPHITDAQENFSGEYSEVLIFLLVGSVTGVLSALERDHRKDLARTAQHLAAVNQQLEASLEQLERADRLSAVGELSAGLAHEIRNPMASIEGAIDVLERNADDFEKREEFLGIIKKECNRVNRLLSDLLDFGRPREPQLQTVRVSDIMDSVVTLANPLAQRQGVRLVTSLSSEYSVRVDPVQMQQVLLNLTLNAIQAMPCGGSVKLSSFAEGSTVNIDVQDEGVGIRQEDFKKVFDPFYTTKERGIGLGLPVAHQIVKTHGGTIKLFCNPSAGMTFRVVLPLPLPRH
jgi:signal transduction histidine kinase